jgi:uncharacterized protein YkwD
MIKKIALTMLMLSCMSVSGKPHMQEEDRDLDQLVQSLALLAVEPNNTYKTPTPNLEQPVANLEQRDPRCVTLEERIHELINGERTKHGLNPLVWNDQLAQAARNHSNDMSTRNYFEHFSPEGHDYLWRYKQVKFYDRVRIGNTSYSGTENIALNTIAMMQTITTSDSRERVIKIEQNLIPIPLETVAQSIVDGLMKSPGHRENILTPHWGREGIGAAITTDQKTGNIVVYVTQNFC